MAFSFEDLTPEAKRAAFAHMDRKRLGSGARHKRLSAKKKSAVEDRGKGTVTGKLGGGSMKGELSAADRDQGTVRGRLPIAKSRPRPAAKPATPEPAADTPESRFDKALTEDVQKLTRGKTQGWAGLVDLRKTLDARGLSRAEQDKHLKRMSSEGKIHIVPEDNRKVLNQADHDAAIRIGGEDNHLVTLADKPSTPDTTPAHTTNARASLGSGKRHSKLAAKTEQATPAAPANRTHARWDKFVHNSIEQLTKSKGDWAGLTDVRRKLDDRGTTRAAQDEHLKRMSREGKIQLVPESNRKALRPEDHDAAIRIGGEDNHLIRIPPNAKGS